MRIVTLDFETDPFEHGRHPEVFACGIFDGENYHETWGDNETVLAWTVETLRSMPLSVVYAHNGGKFDFFYLLPFFDDGSIRIVNGRILQGRLCGQELRDSYGIMPFALSKYEKDEIDYQKFQPHVRDSHKTEIRKYLKKDCTALHTLCVAFHEKFGNHLTIGGTAMEQLSLRHPVKRMGQEHDEKFRPYLFGGRVQCFEQGIITGKLKSYDVNSMYPAVMRDFLHPNGSRVVSGKLPISRYGDVDGVNVYFAHILATSYGAFPARQKDGRLSFDDHKGEFKVTSHELKAALELGLCDIHEVIEVNGFLDCMSFDKHVDHFFSERAEAKAKGDKIGDLFAKTLLNSSYGKFAQNPDNFYDYQLGGIAAARAKAGYEIFEQIGDLVIYRRPADVKSYYDVSTGASITGAARSVLMRAIAGATRPIYCDTDSIICETLSGVDIHPTRLGAWKQEAEFDRAAIVGKKMYSLSARGNVIKVASKGVRMTAEQIERVCAGADVTAHSDAPNFKFSGVTKFTSRTIRSVYD